MPLLRRKYKKRSLKKLHLNQGTVFSLTGLVLILLAGIIVISFFGVSTPTKIVNGQSFNFVGFVTPLLPVAFVIAGMYFLRVKFAFATANSALGAFLFLMSLLSLVSVISPESGGVVGRFLANAASAVVSRPGAIFVFVLLLLASIIIFFNTSLENAIEISGKVYTSASDYLKERWSKRKEERESEPSFTTKGLDESSKAEVREGKEELPSERKPVTNLPTGEVWEYPPLDILTESIGAKANRGDIKQNAAAIERTLDSFGIQAKVVEVNTGPAVTQYALEIALGTKVTKITSLANDIALALAAPTGTVRIEAPIPGKSLVGIEVPNITPEIVPLKNVLTSPKMQKAKSKLELALGLDVSGQPIVSDLDRMPHILIAGSTGSGKSVAINAFISAILFRASPDEVKFILVDPKRVELSNWNGIPHLLTPVIIEPEKVLSALKWTINEMEKRYKLFAEVGARHIGMYNEMSGFQALPYIVIVIDELADIMLFAPVEVEDSITRLAQMSRAVGIHMILATQRPSVDVITGLIKANIPSRMAFNVTSQVDSRVIIDQVGSEKLLGRGDMLYVPPDVSKPQRVQGVFVSEPEISKLIDYLKRSGVPPQYTEEVITTPVSKMAGAGSGSGQDELFEEAVKIIAHHDRASASLLQRRLSVGYARAARLLDQLEEAGVVGVAEGSKARDVLVRDPERVLGERKEKEE